jgi:hypothetical protein
MKTTNHMGLPAPFVRFVESRPERAGLSVTRLIGPAWQRMLLDRHRDEIEQDVSDSVWALFGTAVHDLLERFSSESELVEHRIRIVIDDTYVTGQPEMCPRLLASLTTMKSRFDLFEGRVWGALLGALLFIYICS